MSVEMSQAPGEEPMASVPTPYGAVTGPESAIAYVSQLVADDTKQTVNMTSYPHDLTLSQSAWSEAKQDIWHLIWHRYNETSGEAARVAEKIWAVVERHGGVPPGMKLVPVEPNEAMLINGREALMPLVTLHSYGPLIGMWRDMLAHAPAGPASKVSEGEKAFRRGPKYEMACRLAAQVRETLASGPGEPSDQLRSALSAWEDAPIVEAANEPIAWGLRMEGSEVIWPETRLTQIGAGRLASKLAKQSPESPPYLPIPLYTPTHPADHVSEPEPVDEPPAEMDTTPSPALIADYHRYLEIKARQRGVALNDRIQARSRLLGEVSDLSAEHEVMVGPFKPADWKVEVNCADILQALAGEVTGADWAAIFKKHMGASSLHNAVSDYILNHNGPSPVEGLREALTTAAVRFGEIVDAAAPSNIEYHNEATINGIHANAMVAEGEVVDALTALNMGDEG